MKLRKYFNDARDLCELNKFDAMMRYLARQPGRDKSFLGSLGKPKRTRGVSARLILNHEPLHQESR